MSRGSSHPHHLCFLSIPYLIDRSWQVYPQASAKSKNLSPPLGFLHSPGYITSLREFCCCCQSFSPSPSNSSHRRYRKLQVLRTACTMESLAYTPSFALELPREKIDCKVPGVILPTISPSCQPFALLDTLSHTHVLLLFHR